MHSLGSKRTLSRKDRLIDSSLKMQKASYLHHCKIRTTGLAVDRQDER